MKSRRKLNSRKRSIITRKQTLKGFLGIFFWDLMRIFRFFVFLEVSRF